MQEFGIYFQCYKNTYATYKALESARYFYPSCTIVLLSDNGYNYSEMANFFNCIYIHSEYNLPFITDLNENYIQKSNNLLKRFYDISLLIKENYVMFLEDDVSINNKIIDNFKYDLNGYCPNNLSFVNIKKIKEKYEFVNGKEIFSGHGGSVFNKNTLLKCLKNQEIIDDILLNWKNYNFPSNICQDFLLSVILIFNKYTIGPYEGHNDCGNYKNNNIPVQHQYKVYYSMDLPTELKKLVYTI